MAMDTKRIRDRRERARSRRKATGGDLLKFQEGETKCFLHPSSRPDDTHPETAGLNFIELVIHRDLGGKRNLQLCLDVKNNPILTHPDLIEFLKNRKKNPITLTKKTRCPTCRRIEDGELVGKAADKSAASIQWLFGFTPMSFRKAEQEQWSKMKFVPSPYISGVKIFDQTTAEIERLAPADPTDLNGATLIIVDRVGTTFQDTEYTVSADIESIRKPVKLDKGQRKILTEAIEPGGNCDLIRVASNFVKTPGQMEALMAGVAMSEEREEDEPTEQKECFGDGWSDDEECNACPDTATCKAEVDGAEQEEEAKPESEDPVKEEKQEEEAPKPTTRKRGKKKEEPPPPPPNKDEIDCWGEYEAGDPGCEECDVSVACEADRQPEEEPTLPDEPESDPDLDALEKEAQQVAGKKRRSKGTRK